ncbi:hypothetical protein pb186bvf_004478 [Paramecium bursaria]
MWDFQCQSANVSYEQESKEFLYLQRIQELEDYQSQLIDTLKKNEQKINELEEQLQICETHIRLKDLQIRQYQEQQLPTTKFDLVKLKYLIKQAVNQSKLEDNRSHSEKMFRLEKENFQLKIKLFQLEMEYYNYKNNNGDQLLKRSKSQFEKMVDLQKKRMKPQKKGLTPSKCTQNLTKIFITPKKHQ